MTQEQKEEQDQKEEFSYLLDSLSLYRVKYLELLKEGGPNAELIHCQQAIQFYLSAIIILKNAQKPSNRPALSYKTIFRWFTWRMKPKPEFEDLHTI